MLRVIRNISLVFIVSFFITGNSFSQNLTGIVKGDNSGKEEPLEGAVVKWINTKTGTATDEKGKFELTDEGITDRRIIVFCIGYERDTINIGDKTFIEIILSQNASTETIEVEDEQSSTFISDDIAKTEVITSQELVKDACCDLSGCFGRNSSVEVAVTDILTDSKELKILGLEGAYTQILIDNTPLMSGLNVKYGVSSIPGTMIDRITISKGSNSVLQGYESISGIMNVILKDYQTSDRFLLNGFLNSGLEKQVNLNYAGKLNPKWSSLLTFHSVQKSDRMDENLDGFLDNPLITRYVGYGKLNFADEDNGADAVIAGRYWNEDRIGGQDNFNIDTDEGGNSIYGQTADINSGELYARLGKSFDEEQSMILFFNSSIYNQNSYYGFTKYDASQTNAAFSGFYEFEISKRNFMKAGLSYKYYRVNEDISFNDSTSKTYGGNYLNIENITGIFAENSFNFLDEKGSLMAGLRYDFHNEYGSIITPRALLRYQPANELVFRVSAGTGFRTVDVFSEYSNVLASSRNIIFAEALDPEEVFNFGADILMYFNIGDAGGSVNLDFYRTDFSNKVIPDYDTNPMEVIFSNSTAISNVFQSELNVNLLRNLELKLAYKFVDLQYEINERWFTQPFNSLNRVLTSFSFSPKEDWSFNGGLQWFGPQRIPSTSSNPVPYQRPTISDPFTMINFQLNKNFNNWELYCGVENALDFMQPNPIISAADPFGPYFDTSFIWGPTKGREYYLGFRYILD